MDGSAEECQTATQLKGAIQPISKAAPTLEKVAITADMKVGLGLSLVAEGVGCHCFAEGLQRDQDGGEGHNVWPCASCWAFRDALYWPTVARAAGCQPGWQVQLCDT
jgi:hypothetical protein